jgi:signal transduction histidine kinase
MLVPFIAMNLIDQLAAHRTLGEVPRPELEWLATHGTLRHLEVGELLSAKTRPVDGLFIFLEGRVALFVDRGGTQQKAIEWRGGEVGGLLPYSRMVNPPGDSIVQEPTTLLSVPRECLKEMIRECYEVTAILVHTMIDRARTFTSGDLRNERLLSLGKLSAGLAHELNNPVAAIERGTTLLLDRLEEAERATRVLGAARLSDTQLAALDAVRMSCLASRGKGVRSPLEEAEREEAIADWLADHGLDGRIAEPLAETAVSIAALDDVAASVGGAELAAVLRWAAAGYSVRALAAEVQEAAMRVSGLVVAIKGFTHMDQAAVAEPLDLGRGLGDTVAVLRSKAKAKSVTVAIEVAPDLPKVRGFVGELNQVWSNLIDNALDAVPDGGRVEVFAGRDGTRVVVRVVDNGGGIAPQIRDRIFDPFFTTKPVGQGTGLGLDIVRRLVRHNEGDIDVESQPGRTEFRVWLPLAAQ